MTMKWCVMLRRFMVASEFDEQLNVLIFDYTVHTLYTVHCKQIGQLNDNNSKSYRSLSTGLLDSVASLSLQLGLSELNLENPDQASSVSTLRYFLSLQQTLFLWQQRTMMSQMTVVMERRARPAPRFSKVGIRLNLPASP